MLGGVVVERQQLVQVAGDLRGRLGELGPVGRVECPGGLPGVVFVLGAPDLGQGLLRARVRRLGQRAQDVRCFMEPAAEDKQ